MEILDLSRDFQVPFTNNAAEQITRHLKCKAMLAGNFHSDAGASWYLKISSYIYSARKHGVNAFEAVKLAFEGCQTYVSGFKY